MRCAATAPTAVVTQTHRDDPDVKHHEQHARDAENALLTSAWDCDVRGEFRAP
jgi:hypothetical protein